MALRKMFVRFSELVFLPPPLSGGDWIRFLLHWNVILLRPSPRSPPIYECAFFPNARAPLKTRNKAL